MFNTFSLPGFQCIDGLLLPEHLQLSVGRNSDSILPELFPTVEQYIPISLLLFLKLDYQSLFFDISLPWSDDNTSDILNAHYDLFFPCKSVLSLVIYVFDWLYYIMERIAEQVFFSIFVQFISHLQRKENSCYVMLNPLIIVKPSLFFHGMIRKIVLYCHDKTLRFHLQFLFQM